MSNDKDSAVLDPCQFCGSAAISLTKCRFLRGFMHYGYCNDCSVTGPQKLTEADAIAAWNTRQPTQSDVLAPVGTKGKYVCDGFELPCHVTAHIEGWLEVKFKGDNSPAVIRPSRFAAQEQSK